MATLEDVIPDPRKRKPIYQVFAGIGLVLTATQVGFSAAELSQPVFLTIALAVYAFLAGAGFVLAAGNTSERSNSRQINVLETEPQGKHGA